MAGYSYFGIDRIIGILRSIATDELAIFQIIVGIDIMHVLCVPQFALHVEQPVKSAFIHGKSSKDTDIIQIRISTFDLVKVNGLAGCVQITDIRLAVSKRYAQSRPQIGLKDIAKRGIETHIQRTLRIISIQLIIQPGCSGARHHHPFTKQLGVVQLKQSLSLP